MKKAIIGFLLAIGLVFCATPAVFAEDWTEVSNLTELQAALTAGGNVKLSSDITGITTIINQTSDAVLDLNGHQIVFGSGGYEINVKAKLTIKDSSNEKTGKISSPSYVGLMIYSTGEATLESGEISSPYAIYHWGGTFIMNGGKIKSSGNAIWQAKSTDKTYINGGEIEYTAVYDKNAISLAENGYFEMTGGKITSAKNDIFVDKNSTIIISGGELSANNFNIVGNGSLGSEGTPGASITISDGSFDSTTGINVYQAYAGNLTITGGTFTSTYTNIEVRAGNLNIEGGDFTSTSDTYSVESDGSGATTKGAAVSIAQHTTKQDISVAICGGRFTALVPFSEANIEGNDQSSIDKVTGEITSCSGVDEPEFISTGTKAIESEDFTAFISAGYFEPELNDTYVATGYEKKARGAGYLVSNAWLEVIVETPENGTASASLTDVLEGEEVEITTTPNEEYKLDTITVTDADGADVAVSNGKFTMPAKDVTVTVAFKKIKRAITVETPENGSASASVAEAAKGDEVTITTTPADGYELDAIVIKDADGAEITVTDGKFTMPAKAVTITVTFKEKPAEEPETTPTPETADTDVESPKTYDDIATYFVIMGASLGGLTAAIISKKRF